MKSRNDSFLLSIVYCLLFISTILAYEKTKGFYVLVFILEKVLFVYGLPNV